jgi:hypothetical protein
VHVGNLHGVIDEHVVEVGLEHIQLELARGVGSTYCSVWMWMVEIRSRSLPLRSRMFLNRH